MGIEKPKTISAVNRIRYSEQDVANHELMKLSTELKAAEETAKQLEIENRRLRNENEQLRQRCDGKDDEIARLRARRR